MAVLRWLVLAVAAAAAAGQALGPDAEGEGDLYGDGATAAASTGIESVTGPEDMAGTERVEVVGPAEIAFKLRIRNLDAATASDKEESIVAAIVGRLDGAFGVEAGDVAVDQISDMGPRSAEGISSEGEIEAALLQVGQRLRAGGEGKSTALAIRISLSEGGFAPALIEAIGNMVSDKSLDAALDEEGIPAAQCSLLGAPRIAGADDYDAQVEQTDRGLDQAACEEAGDCESPPVDEAEETSSADYEADQEERREDAEAEAEEREEAKKAEAEEEEEEKREEQDVAAERRQEEEDKKAEMREEEESNKAEKAEEEGGKREEEQENKQIAREHDEDATEEAAEAAAEEDEIERGE